MPFDLTAQDVLDTPAPKRPRLQSPEKAVPLESPFSLPGNALSPSKQTPPPSTAPGRPSHVSAIPKVNYSKDLADIVGESTEDSLDDVKPEDSSEDSAEDDTMYINDIDEMFADMEEAEFEEDGSLESTATPSNSDKYKAFTDEDGLLRIGPQPYPPLVHVQWAPKKLALKRIKLFSKRSKDQNISPRRRASRLSREAH